MARKHHLLAYSILEYNKHWTFRASMKKCFSCVVGGTSGAKKTEKWIGKTLFKGRQIEHIHDWEITLSTSYFNVWNQKFTRYCQRLINVRNVLRNVYVLSVWYAMQHVIILRAIKYPYDKFGQVTVTTFHWVLSIVWLKRKSKFIL